jgi:hypothetical protein
MVTAAFFGSLPLDAAEARAIDELKAAMMAIDPTFAFTRGQKVDEGVWQRLEEVQASWRAKYPHMARQFAEEEQRLHGEKCAPPPPDPAAGGGRDKAGRFTKGNSYGNAGNPFIRRLTANRAAILRAVSTEEIQQLGRSLLKRGLAGDVAAAVALLT